MPSEVSGAWRPCYPLDTNVREVSSTVRNGPVGLIPPETKTN
jgi:hypothetical protein